MSKVQIQGADYSGRLERGLALKGRFSADIDSDPLTIVQVADLTAAPYARDPSFAFGRYAAIANAGLQSGLSWLNRGTGVFKLDTLRLKSTPADTISIYLNPSLAVTTTLGSPLLISSDDWPSDVQPRFSPVGTYTHSAAIPATITYMTIDVAAAVRLETNFDGLLIYPGRVLTVGSLGLANAFVAELYGRYYGEVDL
jgi:hypothetical protein